jgi:hypothetical protein
MLEQELLVPNLFQEQGVDQFKGAENDTISMKVEGILPFHDYAWRNDCWNPIVFDENAGRTIAVTFGGNVYSAVKLTVCRGLERRPAVVRGGFSPTRHTAAPPAGSRPERSVGFFLCRSQRPSMQGPQQPGGGHPESRRQPMVAAYRRRPTQPLPEQHS